MWQALVGWSTEEVWCAKHRIGVRHVASCDSRRAARKEPAPHQIQTDTWRQLIG